MSTSKTTRRRLLLGSVAAAAATSTQPSGAFGEEGAFNPRILLTGTQEWEGKRRTAPARWSLEVVGRTSAPARLSPSTVRADAPELLSEPFAVWSGASEPSPLTRSELRGLRSFLSLGGVLFVDDHATEDGAFLAGAKRQLARVLPQGSPIAIGDENVVFRSFYLLREAAGRVERAPKLEAIVRGGLAQIILSPNDLLGALAREAGGVHPFETEPGGSRQRERSVRLAVNIAMFVLCSNYKDDQVHAPFLMRRRATGSP